MVITVFGGGGLGHTCAGMLSQHSDVRVNMLTSKVDLWHKTFDLNTPNGVLKGRLNCIADKAEDVIPQSDMVLLCLPAFMVEKAIVAIKPWLSVRTLVGTVVSSSGFFLFCHKLLSQNIPLFGFQRVPYISRIVEYGRSANLLGFRDELIVATENIADKEDFAGLCQKLFAEKVRFADSFYEVTLSNSNPILHTGRLYTMWKNWDGKPVSRCPLFYKEWTKEASEIEIKMDEEFFALLHALHVKTDNIDTLLEHYEARNAEEMTKKLQSIQALSAIQSPMKKTDEGWVPDFGSRYFTEDFPFGLKAIHDLAHRENVSCPYIDQVYQWGMSRIG